jgi:signal transduction histidine kinase
LVGAPIAVQIVGFLIASLVTTQIVNLAVVLLVPPPTPPVYQMGDIVQALQGHLVQPRFGRALARTTGAEPSQPALFRLSALVSRLRGRPSGGWSREAPGWRSTPANRGRRLQMDRRDLALLMGLAEAKVRFWQVEAPPWSNGHAFWPQPRGGAGADQGDGPPPPTPNPGPSNPGPAPRRGAPSGPSGTFRFDPLQRPIVGEFVAAAQLPDHRWVTVRPEPERFPNGWQWRIILWFAGWLALFSLAGYLFARRMTAPIGAFARAAEQLGRDPGGAPMALSGPAELGVVARAFNDMQVRIKRYVDDRTAMVGAISHDLRTPLTRIRFKVEGAAPDLRDAVLADVSQMEAMISAVLAFIRDANAPARRERLDLLSLLECEVDGAALVGADVVMLDAKPVTIAADPVALRGLFANLIENAVKYAGGAQVSLDVEGDEAVVRVMDDGPGLSSVELERAFDPFYRAEPSRNRDSGGVGLGLSVARSIARGHGGDVVLEPRPKGLMAVVRLPLPPAES